MEEYNLTDCSVGRRTMVITGGGTGGHLFPGVAIAKEWERVFKDSSVVFIAGRRGIERQIISHYGYRAVSIDMEGVKGRGVKNALKVLAKLPLIMFKCAGILRDLSPTVVIGMGGYSSVPVCLTSKLMGIPTAIHEQNSYPGLANRLLSRFADMTFISFEDSLSYLKPRQWLLTGTPVREEILTHEDISYMRDTPFSILVMGGSQGARAINIAFAKALFILKGMGREVRVTHQTGQMDHERTVKDYKEKGIEASIVPFITEMGRAYQDADLVISRAGASSIFELSLLQKPSILIPYPYAANQHQKANAMSLVRAGGAEMIEEKDLTGPALAEMIIRYMDDPRALVEMGRKAGNLSRPDAARHIVAALKEMVF